MPILFYSSRLFATRGASDSLKGGAVWLCYSSLWRRGKGRGEGVIALCIIWSEGCLFYVTRFYLLEGGCLLHYTRLGSLKGGGAAILLYRRKGVSIVKGGGGGGWHAFILLYKGGAHFKGGGRVCVSSLWVGANFIKSSRKEAHTPSFNESGRVEQNGGTLLVHCIIKSNRMGTLPLNHVEEQWHLLSLK